MNVNYISTNVYEAVKNYRYDNDKFNASMKNYYAEGQKNPSVAKIIFHEHKDKMLNDIRRTGSGYTGTMSTLNADSFYHSPTKTAVTSYNMDYVKKGVDILNLQDDKKLNNIPGKKEFDEAFAKLYPKTGKIRERYIETGHLKIGKTTPKLPWTKKQIDIKSLKELKETYPKTYLARIDLIAQGQIIDNKITPKLTGWFNRNNVKSLIKKGFSFLK